MLFWKQYSLKRTIMFSFVFAIGIFLSVNMILNRGGIIGWILMGLAAGFLANLWLKPRRARKKLTAALEMMNEEKYAATFTENQIEIETIVEVNQESSKNAEDAENIEESEVSDVADVIDKSVFPIATEELYSRETSEMFTLFVNRALIYVFPKRCLSEHEVESLRNYFAEKRIC
jgi:hypothetical protein